jgi:mannose-P-dolichol utilization defect protein 1
MNNTHVMNKAFVKLPQIAKVVSSKSAAGLSLLSYLLETAAYTVTLAYNYRRGNPFSTYGETFFVTVQNVLLLALILGLRRRVAALLLLLVAGAAAVVALQQPRFVSAALLVQLQTATIPVGLASKVPQIWSNWKAKSTGQLSAATVFLFFAGSLAR